MRILLLTDASNPHSQKWIHYLRQKGVDLHVLSLIAAEIEGVNVHTFYSSAFRKRKSNVEYNRIAVLMEVLPQIRKRIRQIRPDIVHSHYLSSFGLFGAISGFHPLIVSVWGSDITDFPYKNIINRSIVQFVLKKADRICVSSQHLISETAKFTTKTPDLIYFGTDFEQFKPLPVEEQAISAIDKICPAPFIFGTVKGLYRHYGINYLIEAAAIFGERINNKNWQLWIGGNGVLYDELLSLSKKLGIETNVRFWGRIAHQELPDILNRMDALVVPSLRESFGVIAVEASGCGLPLIVTNTGGLPETIKDGETGYCVEPANPQAITDKLLLLYNNKALRQQMGQAGREYVRQRYSWQENADKMMSIYESLIRSK